MADKIEGYLEVGVGKDGNVVVNLDRDRIGHIVFSPDQARGLAATLMRKAIEAEIKTGCPWLTWEHAPGSEAYARQLAAWLDAEFAPVKHTVNRQGDWWYVQLAEEHL
jgi:hypothetical protein